MAFVTAAQKKFLDKSTCTPQEAAIIRAAFQLTNAVAPTSLLDSTSATKLLVEACQKATDR
jgi:hypothetical protein